MARLSARKIISAIGCPYLSLHKGEGYWYFVYDSNDDQVVYGTESVPVFRLSHLSFDRWLTIGADFVNRMQQIHIIEDY